MRSTAKYEQRLLSEMKAAAWLGMSQRTLWQRRHDGLIPFVRDGGRIKYDIGDLTQYVDERRVDKTTPSAIAEPSETDQ
tara:strand:+ start:23306 stop:23542 length:237 start_codon:yes stop_codon:yes gene_type:complete